MSTKRVLITGAGSGFGKGAAVELAARGHDVIAGTFDEAQADELRHEAPALTVVKLDITDPSDIAKVAEMDLDVVLNNAGAGCLGPLARVPMDDIRHVFEVNVFGTIAVTKAALRKMIERGSGRILIVSSIAGLIIGPVSAPYSMTKHSLEVMGGALHAELEPYGIDVGLINPGPYGTGFNDAMAVAAVDRFAGEGVDTPDAEQVQGLHDLITIDQGDPTEVVDAMVALVEADDIPLQTPVPADLLERFGLA